MEQIPGTISVFATATGTLQTTLEPGGNPWMLSFAKQGAQAEVLNYASTGFIQSINTTSWTVGRSVGAAGSTHLSRWNDDQWRLALYYRRCQLC